MSWLADVKQLGIAGWTTYAVDRLLGRITRGRGGFHVLRFYVQPVPEMPDFAAKPGDAIHIAPIAPDTVDPAAFGRPLEAIADRFGDGSVCIAALKDKELIGFMWLQAGMLRERIVRCHMHALPAGRVEWDYDFFIEPRYRFGRLFGRLWQVAAQSLRDRNVEATVSWVKLGNRASEQAHARLGARPIGWAVFLVLFGHQLMVTSMRPRIAYSRPGVTPDLHVDLARVLPQPEPRAATR